MLEHDRRLGNRIEELERHLDLLARDLREQVSVACGLEVALSWINHFIRLPVDPEVWLAG
jgi:hypothetical protein